MDLAGADRKFADEKKRQERMILEKREQRRKLKHDKESTSK